MTPTAAISEVSLVNPKPTKTLADDDAVAFVGMADLDDTTAVAADVELRAYRDVAKGYTPFEYGDILLAKITPCFENMKIGQARTSTELAWGSTEFHVMRPKDGVLDNRYLLHFLRQPWVLELGELRMTGSAGQRRVPKRFLDELEIPLPPIEEQRRIGAVLDAADALRAKRRQTLARLDTLTQAVFIDMFGPPGSNQQRYEIAPMIELVDPDRPITYGILKPGEDISDGVPYVRVLDMVDGSIDADGLKRTTPEISSQYSRSILERGDLLMSIRGHVGRLASVSREVAGANITQDTARLAITGAEPTYILECLRSVEIQRWMAVFTKGAAVRGINLTDVKKIPVPLPPRAQQRRFAKLVDRAQTKRTAQVAAAAQLDTLFASLQQRAFRGEL